MEGIGAIFELFHELSVGVVILLVALTIGACFLMVRVFRGDFDNINSQL